MNWPRKVITGGYVEKVENFINRRRKDMENIRKEKKNQQRRERRRRQREAENPRPSNEELYSTFDINQRIAFAANGYCFDHQPDIPAIELFTTTIITEPGRNRGIRVGKALERLPPGFIILYSMENITNTPADGIQRQYQVYLPGNRYMQIHTEPSTPFGLANFINSTIPKEGNPASLLTEITDQNMKVAQCELTYSTHRNISPENKNLYPAYVKVKREIPQGHELLMSYGPSYHFRTRNNNR